MPGLFKNDKIPQRFEWNDEKWQKRDSTDRPGYDETAYRLASAIIRTKWDGADEYLSVHWPKDEPDNPFVRGKQWIEAFNERKATASDLCEVCTLFYRWMAPSQLS
jgi:hypothetical protein